VGRRDIVFYTHGLPETGFGHAARCAKISALIKKKRSRTMMTFAGEFSDSARAWLQSFGAIDVFCVEPAPATVGIYDRMDDIENPEVVDYRRLQFLLDRCSRVILFANGRVIPDVPEGVTVIGYKPAWVSPQPPRLYWSLEFAPVAEEASTTATLRAPGRALVALGGARGSTGLRTVMNAIAALPQISFVDVLDSPVNPLTPETDWLRGDQKLQTHRGVASVSPFLWRAGLVIASYGHLGYEALACGAPLCLVGQKTFQALYADRLAERGLCVSAGLLANLTVEQLASALASTLASAEALSSAARKAVDGRGLERIVGIILDRLEQAA
jgi:spore coat polysaccharide biosynthesis predicted glycosyltransferase SpsG